MTIQINVSNEVPDSTYFRTGDVEPTIEEDKSITILDGKGSRRSWGSPQVTSQVVYQSEDFISVHIGYSHKHRGGQFWRHYSINGAVTQMAWRQLDDSLRAEILEAYERLAPAWAKSPGKLRKDYAYSSTTMTTYKAVNANMRSLYDGSTEYEIGKRLVEAVSPKAGENDWGDVIHGGGFYSHPSIEAVKELIVKNDLVPLSRLTGVKELVIVKCEISGRIVKFPNGKIASTYLRPTEVVEVIQI